jgi:hypothetical protein
VTETTAWDLESFLDSLIVELDRAQDTLAVKGMTRRATYTVHDVALDMHVFPEYGREGLRFTSARPGDEGASRISLQLGSITDRQIREVASEPPRADDISIDQIEGLDEESQRALQRVGVRTARDLEKLDQREVDVGRVVSEKGGADFSSMSDLINRARRGATPPRLSNASSVVTDRGQQLVVEGEDLVPPGTPAGYPVAVLDGRPVEVVEAGPTRIVLDLPSSLGSGDHVLQVALDPYADFSCTITD